MYMCNKIRAKDYLWQIRKLNAIIDSDLETIATLEALATRTTPILKDDVVQMSGSQQRMEDAVCRMVDMKDKLSREIDALIEMKDEARHIISLYCDCDCVTLLTKRYLGVFNPNTEEINYLTWEQIAVDMGYTYQCVAGRIHKRALRQLQVGLDENSVKNLQEMMINDKKE